MIEKKKCSHCAYIEPYAEDFGICNCKESHYYNQEVGANNCCERFVNNPTEYHYSKGMASLVVADEGYLEGWKEAIFEFGSALKLGLSLRDEVLCRYGLSDAYRSIGEITKAVKQLKDALSLDASYHAQRTVSQIRRT